MSKKGENIYKRKDGRWEARYIKGCSTEGKTVYGYCYGKTYREAKVKVTEAKAYLTQKTYIPGVGSRRCLASYCGEWLQLNRSKVKESTYVKYLSMLEKHVKPKLGSYYIQSLSSRGGQKTIAHCLYVLYYYIITVTGGGCFERTEISFISFR